MNEGNNSWLTPSGISINSGTGTYISGNSILDTFSSLTVQNMTQQVKVAVFEVTRNEDGKIESSKFLKELWVEKKNGISVDLVVAKELDKDFDPQNIVVREIYTVSF